MVFVWSNLLDGEPHFTLSQVAVNDLIMVVAFAPLVGLLLGLAAITVPWDTLLLSVMLYIVVPVILAQLLRKALLARGGEERLRVTLARFSPVSLVALLATLVLLFGFQGEQIVAQPLVIALLAIPIVIQVYFNAGLAYLLNRWSGEAHCVAGPSALIGASNFFELAVAAAISLFGLQSGAALATVVGVLIEVPVMLSVVAIVRRSKGLVRSRNPAQLAIPHMNTDTTHDLPQPGLRHLAQHAGTDPRQRHRTRGDRIPEDAAGPRHAASAARTIRHGCAGPAAREGHPVQNPGPRCTGPFRRCTAGPHARPSRADQPAAGGDVARREVVPAFGCGARSAGQSPEDRVPEGRRCTDPGRHDCRSRRPGASRRIERSAAADRRPGRTWSPALRL